MTTIRVGSDQTRLAIRFAAFALILVVIGLTTVLIYWLWPGSSGADNQVEQAVTLPAVEPLFLASPLRVEGPGWTTETRVSNLTGLDLGLAVQIWTYPSQLAVVDVPSGKVVAAGTFGTDGVVAHLRRDPPQLLVIDHDARSLQARLLAFDLQANKIAPLGELPLPLRSVGGDFFSNTLTLSGNQRYLFVYQSVPKNATSSCFEGAACSVSSVAVVDLDALALVSTIQLPEACGGAAVTPLEGDGFVARCLSNDVVFVRDPFEPKETLRYEGVLITTEYGTLDGEIPMLATVLPNGEIRVLGATGVIEEQPGDVTANADLGADPRILQADRIDDKRALIVTGGDRARWSTTRILVIDLEDGKVLAEAQAPPGMLWATPLDGAHAALLSRTGTVYEAPGIDPGTVYELRQLNLETAEVSVPVVLDGLAGDTFAIVR